MLRTGLTLVVTVTSFIAAGVVTELAHEHPLVQAAAITMGFLIVFPSLLMVVRQSESSLMWVVLAGAFVGILGLVGFTYGTYIAYLSGWSSLDVAQFGSDDHRGQAWISIVLAIWILPIALVGAVASALVWAFGHGLRSRQP